MSAIGCGSSGRRVGLLGGSFNPAHQGHLAISKEAVKRLDLNEIWWLVSPQNPLKSSADMAAYDQRLAGAKRLANQGQSIRIHVSDFERRAGTRFTADTIRKLRRRYPATLFIWLMGADNLAQLHQWYHWHDILANLPVAVLDRPGWTYRALASRAALRYSNQRCYSLRVLARKFPPAWSFLFARRHKFSATEIRANDKKQTQKHQS